MAQGRTGDGNADNCQDFYQRNLRTVNAILRKSTLISGYAERERNCFFNNIRDRIIQVRDNLPAL